jgi:hypothetical protein
MATERDELLGAALRQLPVPRHRAGFADEVWARVDALPARRAQRGGLGRRRGLALVAAAVGVVTVTIGLVLAGVPGVHRSAPQTATALEVAARMAGSLRSLHSLRGSYVSDWGAGRTRGTFAADAAGDHRSDSRTSHEEAVAGRYHDTRIYNAADHVLLDYGWDKGTNGTAKEGTLKTPSADELAMSGFGPFGPMATLVRAALAEGDPDIRIAETVFDGRSAWRADFTKRAFRDSLRGVTVIVDRATGILLQYRHRDDPHREPSWTYAVTRLQVDPALPAGLFDIAPPKGVRVVDVTTDAYCSLEEAESRAGYVPMVATATFAPFKLAAAGTFPRGSTCLQFFSSRPPATPGPGAATEVMLQYRLGLDSYVIRQALISERDRKVLERQDRRLSRAPTYRSEVLRSGAFAGERAETWFSTLGAFLEVHSSVRCVRISGDLTRQELLSVAASLELAHD